MQLESINHLSGVYSSLITSPGFSLTLPNCLTGAGIFTVFLVSCLSLRITLRFLFASTDAAVDAGAATAATPASIRIMLISVSSFKIIQINLFGFLLFFTPRAHSRSHHTPGPIKNSTLAARLTKNDQNINTLMHIPRALFGLDHLLLLLF